MRTLALVFVFALVAVVAAPIDQAYAAKDAVYTSTFGNTAVSGYDPVAYFKEGRAIEGDSRFTHTWNGATWRFSSQENLDAFRSNPEAYAPQYGGYCAWAVSQGYTASTDPNAWRIVDGKLFLNYSKGVQRQWAEDIPGNIRAADANWPAVLNK